MTCLSDLYYRIGYWFTVVMFIIAIATIPFALNVWDSVFSFLMCAGIAFVGAAPNYKGSEHDLHYCATLTSMVCSVIWVANVSSTWLFLFFPAVLLSAIDRRRWLLYLELSCFASVYGALIQHSL